MQTIYYLAGAVRDYLLPVNQKAYFVDELHKAIEQISHHRFVGDNIFPVGEKIGYFLYDKRHFYIIDGMRTSGHAFVGLRHKAGFVGAAVTLSKEHIKTLYKRVAYYFSLLSTGWCLQRNNSFPVYARNLQHCFNTTEGLQGMYDFYNCSLPFMDEEGILIRDQDSPNCEITLTGPQEKIEAFLARMRRESVRTCPSLHLFFLATNDPAWVATNGLVKDLVRKIAVLYFTIFMRVE